MGGLADESGDVHVGRPVVNILRATDLHDHPVIITGCRSAIAIASVWSCVT